MTLEIILVVAAVVVFVVIFDALRRRRLTEGFAMMWGVAGVAAVLLAIGRPVVDALADAIGVAYGPTLVFAIAIVFLTIVSLVLSMQVTRLRTQVEALAQELALRSSSTDEELAMDDDRDGDDER